MRLEALPEGFRVSAQGSTTLVAERRRWDALVEAGLARPEGWQRRVGGGAGGGGAGGGAAGRGPTAVLALGSGDVVRLKQLRRGGRLAGLWRERFAGTGRLVDNLSLPLEAERRGVPTSRPVALLLVQGPPRLYRGWLATEELERVRSLRSCLVSDGRAAALELAAAMAVVRRMHDAGIDHRDLNLGNIVVRRDGAGELEAFVLDFDRARTYPAPLGFRARQRALRRLERSYVKSVAEPDETVRELFCSRYAAEDEALARRLARGRLATRGFIFLHRLGWRR